MLWIDLNPSPAGEGRFFSQATLVLPNAFLGKFGTYKGHCVCVCVRASSIMRAQSCLTLCDPMDYVARQASLSMEFSRQEYWNGLPFPPHPGIEPMSLMSLLQWQVDSLLLCYLRSPQRSLVVFSFIYQLKTALRRRFVSLS